MKGNQRVVLTQRLLQEALLRLMERKALDKINVSELCAEAGINRATFYRHYALPRDVLVQMQAQFVEAMRSSLDTPALYREPYRYVEKMCTCLYENAELVRIFIRNNSEEDIIALFDGFFLELLRENRSITGDRSLDRDESKLISAYMAGGGYFMLRRWLLEGIDKSPQEIAGLVLSFADPKLC